MTTQAPIQAHPPAPKPSAQPSAHSGAAPLQPLCAPFPYFGGKSKVGRMVWERFGDVAHYIEPFFGSGAVFWARPQPHKIATLNDKNRFLCNFWRALQHAPDEVARAAQGPVNETDLNARHRWLVTTGAARLEALDADPFFYDAQIAGWWVWGQSCWLGSGWCEGASKNGESTGAKKPNRQMPTLTRHGCGIHSKLPILTHHGCGVHQNRPHLATAGKGVQAARLAGLQASFAQLADRLSVARVCCGDWGRIVTPCVLESHPTTGIFLDPPYSAKATARRKLYAVDSLEVAHEVRQWAIANGNNPRLRIALCGYEGEHPMPRNWACVAWKSGGGYANQNAKKANENRQRERIWFSPHCQKQGTQAELF